jgi:hypothetical protein
MRDLPPEGQYSQLAGPPSVDCHPGQAGRQEYTPAIRTSLTDEPGEPIQVASVDGTDAR